jgi:hypothetical protein
MTSWKERREKLKEKTRESAQNREGKTSTILTYAHLDGRDVLWVDKPKTGRTINKYDHIPFVVTNPDYKNMKKFTGKPTNLDPGDVDYKLEYPVHKLPTGEAFVCLKEGFGEPCGGCEEVARLYDEGTKQSNEAAGKIRARWRCLYNIIDLNSDDEIRLWDESYHNYEKLLLNEVIMGDEGLEIFWDLEEGKTVEWRGDSKTIGANSKPFTQAGRIDFRDRDPYEESILKEAYPLDQMFIKPTYEQTVQMISGAAAETSDEGEEKDRSNKSNRRSRPPREQEQAQTSVEDDDIPFNDDTEKKKLCSQGREFGIDFNKHPECQNCADEEYNSCQEENENPKEQRRTPEPDPEPEKPSGRRNRAESSSSDEGSTGRRRRRSR